MRCGWLILVGVLAMAGTARADLQPPVNPKWHVCRGEHAPDAPGFGKRIALTFDDGPSVKQTPKVLAVLRKHKVPATFFVVGRRLGNKRARALVREIHRDPLFSVGNHSQTHPRLPTLKPAEVAREVDQVTAALAKLGIAARFFRFPYAASTCATAKLVRDRGFAVAGWHIDSADWCFAAGGGRCAASTWAEVPDQLRGDMVGLILERARANDGGIVLLHDIHWRTVRELDGLIKALRAAGFRFVHLDDAKVFPRLASEL